LSWQGRSARPSDLDALAPLVALVMDPGWSRAQLSQALADPMGRIRLAESATRRAGEDRLLGFVFARRILDVLEIDLVGVRPGMRQCGIASGLLRGLLDSEGERGLAEARLELAASNEPARRLYAGLGFVVVGTRSRYYPTGDDALLLSRTRFEPMPPGRRSDPPE